MEPGLGMKAEEPPDGIVPGRGLFCGTYSGTLPLPLGLLEVPLPPLLPPGVAGAAGLLLLPASLLPPADAGVLPPEGGPLEAGVPFGVDGLFSLPLPSCGGFQLGSDAGLLFSVI